MNVNSEKLKNQSQLFIIESIYLIFLSQFLISLLNLFNVSDLIYEPRVRHSSVTYNFNVFLFEHFTTIEYTNAKI